MGYILPSIVAAVVGFAIGMVWYGPLFGKQWMKLTKTKKKDMKPDPKVFGVALVRQLVTAVVIATLLVWPSITTADALLTLFIMWLGFTAMPAISGVLWEKKPLALYFINISYELVSMAVMTIIITSWL